MNVPRDWERGEGTTALVTAGSSGYRRTWMYSCPQTVHSKMTMVWMGELSW